MLIMHINVTNNNCASLNRKRKGLRNSESSNSLHSSSHMEQASGFDNPTILGSSVYSYLDDAVTDDAKVVRTSNGSLYGGSIEPYASMRTVERQMRPEPPGLRVDGGTLRSMHAKAEEEPGPSESVVQAGGVPVYAVPMKKLKPEDDDLDCRQ
jgi:hypothetical protein